MRPTDFLDDSYNPIVSDPAAVASTAATLGVGLDTAAFVVRRDTIQTLIDAYRTGGVYDHTKVCDILDAMLAAAMDVG